MEIAVRRSLSGTAFAGMGGRDEFLAISRGCFEHSMGLQRLSLYIYHAELLRVYVPNLMPTPATLYWPNGIDVGFTEQAPGRQVAALYAKRGVLVENSANRLRFSPPLTISEDDLIIGARIVDRTLRDVAAQGEIPGGEYIN